MGYKIDAAFEKNGGVYIKHGTATQLISSNARLLGFTPERVVYIVNGERTSRYVNTMTGQRGVLH